MFEKCIKCEHLGKDCFPNLYIMPVDKIRDWAMKLKEYKGLTNAELSEKSGVPKGTIDVHFSKKNKYSADVNYSTFAPILCALMECENKEMKCPTDPCKFAEESERIEYFKEQMKIIQKTSSGRMKAVIVLGILLGITLFLIILSLYIDSIDYNVGFFWRQ